MSEETVFVYCDDASHPARKPKVAVTNFMRIGETANWTEVYASRAGGARDSGATLVDDAPPAPWSGDPGEDKGREVRSRYSLACRKCRRRPLVLREESLFGALEKLRRADKENVSLRELGAILGVSGKP